MTLYCWSQATEASSCYASPYKGLWVQGLDMPLQPTAEQTSKICDRVRTSSQTIRHGAISWWEEDDWFFSYHHPFQIVWLPQIHKNARWFAFGGHWDGAMTRKSAISMVSCRCPQHTTGSRPALSRTCTFDQKGLLILFVALRRLDLDLFTPRTINYVVGRLQSCWHHLLSSLGRNERWSLQ